MQAAVAQRVILNGEMSALIAAHDLISFDVFDTLIFRKVSKPTDVFSLVKVKLLAAPEALLHQRTVDAFPELRVRAERLARAEKHQRVQTREVTLDEIYCQTRAALGRQSGRCRSAQAHGTGGGARRGLPQPGG